MASSTSSFLLLFFVLMVCLSTVAKPMPDQNDGVSQHRYHHRRHHPRNQPPPGPPSPTPPSPTPPGPPPPPLPQCDCRCNCSQCYIEPPFLPPPPGVGRRGSRRSPAAPRVPPAPRPALPVSPTDCVTPLAGLMACGGFLTGSQPETPTPQSDCCRGLAAFFDSASAVAAAGGGDWLLRCLCPVILGDVNKSLTKPVDPVRMMYLPIACGVALTPQSLSVCFVNGQQPHLVPSDDSSGKGSPSMNPPGATATTNSSTSSALFP